MKLTTLFVLSLYLLTISLNGEVSSEKEILESSSNPLASIYGVPETNIHGVNVINGDYGFAVVDFQLPGSNPLRLQRTYSSGTTQRRALFDGWSHNFCSVICEGRNNKYKFAVSQGALSGEIPYKLRDEHYKDGSESKHKCKINRLILSKGVSNCGMGEISGRTNLKNCMINLTNESSDWIRQINGDCSQHNHRLFKGGDGSRYYYLKDSYYPTGCTVEYDTAFYNLKRVAQYDWQGNQTHMLSTTVQNVDTLNKLAEKLKPFHFDYFSNDGRKTTYHFKCYKNKISKIYSRVAYLKKIESTHAPTEEYSYKDEKGKIHRKLKERRGSLHRTQIQYYGLGDTMHVKGYPTSIDKKKRIAFERVKQINVAVNDMNHCERLCWFAYGKNEKEETAFTDAYDPYNHLTRYNYSTKDYRLRTIERYRGQGLYEIYRTDRMRWGDSDTKDEANLITRVIQNGLGAIQFAEMYHYDDRGNVLRKIYSFRRSTSLSEHPIDWSGKLVIGGECRILRSEFNTLNLPILEDDGRITTQFSYLKRHHHKLDKTVLSSLIASKIQNDSHGIIKREFFDYDQAIGCILHVVDDGSGTELTDLSNIRQRTITRSVNSKGNFAGLPIETSTWGLDTTQNQERLIQRIEFEYDNHGHVTTQRRFDSNNAYAYSTQKQCDMRGNVLTETDPLGQVTSREYNKYHCLLREQGPCPSYFTVYEYDLLQRPIKTTLIYNDGLSLSTLTSYDLNNNPIREIGIYGQTTTKIYNEQKLPKTIIHPPIRLDKGIWESPTTCKTYDIFGHLASETNALEAITTYQHNPEGKVLSIKHPDGTEELFCYSIYGDLIEKTSQNGTKIVYTHDSQSRVLSETLYDINGSLLKSHTYLYEGSLLASEKQGDLETKYTYDHAGRMISKEVGKGRSEYYYDALGRQIETRVYYGESSSDYISYKKQYDLLNRVIEEQEVDFFGKIHTQKNYTYDERGNVISTIKRNHAGLAISTSRYDPRGNLCAEIDALGNTTRYIHRYDYFFEGQLLPCVEAIDPTGVKRITVSDHHKNVVAEQVYSPLGDLISNTELFYDLAGNIRRKEYKLPKETIKSIYEYDSCNRLIKQINGAGTLEQIVTTFAYNSFGELTETIYADGTSKNHSYDGVGRLKMEWANDGSVSYVYTYNKQDLLIRVENRVLGTSTKREYTSEGYLLSEQFENGLIVNYTYDRMGRVTSFTYPDGTSIQKSYNPVFLSKAERIVNDNVIYEAIFSDFDLTGLPRIFQFPKNSGTLVLNYDLLNRPVNVCYPHLVEDQILYDSRGLLISKRVNSSLQTFEHDHLGQLSLEQTSLYEHIYENDALNRQIVVDGLIQTHNAVNQLIDGIHGEYSFDQKGRRIRDSDIQFIYDRFDRLIEINRSHKQWKFTYDAFNRKMSRSLDGITHNYIYHGDEEIGSFDVEGCCVDLKILSGEDLSLPVAIELSDRRCAPIISMQGHIVGLVDFETGKLLNESPLTMYGEDLTDTPLSPWRFCGKRHELLEIGIIDFGFRYYHTKSAQWLIQDPLGESDGPNMYAYVKNSPTRYIDRYGLFWDDYAYYGLNSSLMENQSTIWEMALSSPRFMGGIQALGGAGQATIGGFAALGSGGLLAIPGGLAMAHGTDHFITGCRQMYNGEFQDSATSQLLQYSGMSQESASLVDSCISIALTSGCGLINSFTKTTSNLSMIAATQGDRCASSSVQALRLKNSLIAREIGGGHAFEKHVLQQGEYAKFIRTRSQFMEHIENVLNYPTEIKKLSNNRVGYWHEPSKSVVVYNPKAADGGTAFQPKKGREYFLKELW